MHSAFFHELRISEIIATAAVFLTFMHASVADRLQEQQAIKAQPDVWCHYKLKRYFLGKEALWILFFILIQSWAALLGSVIFFLYPFWRQWYRQRYPLGRDKA